MLHDKEVKRVYPYSCPLIHLLSQCPALKTYMACNVDLLNLLYPMASGYKSKHHQTRALDHTRNLIVPGAGTDHSVTTSRKTQWCNSQCTNSCQLCTQRASTTSHGCSGAPSSQGLQFWFRGSSQTIKALVIYICVMVTRYKLDNRAGRLFITAEQRLSFLQHWLYDGVLLHPFHHCILSIQNNSWHLASAPSTLVEWMNDECFSASQQAWLGFYYYPHHLTDKADT